MSKPQGIPNCANVHVKCAKILRKIWKNTEKIGEKEKNRKNRQNSESTFENSEKY